MPKLVTYFISRLNKIGELSHDNVIEALGKPIPVKSRTSSYTITDFSQQSFLNQTYYFGRLTKYKTEGLVQRIDHEYNRVVDQIEPDLITASSDFLFIPDHSAFVFQLVWNEINHNTFSERIREIILSKRDFYFVDCKLEPLTDIKSFLQKIRRFSYINEIKAKVNPPNPLFGHLWKSLEKYLRKRTIEELSINEKSYDQPINSNLIELLNLIDTESVLTKIDSSEIAIGDAAVLMSIDGYGNAQIKGRIGNRKAVIRTDEKSISFQFPSGENIDELFREAKSLLDNINDQRYLDHVE